MRILVAFGCLTLLVSCSDKNGGAGGEPDLSAVTQDGGVADLSGGGASGLHPFSYGINLGYYGSQFNDVQTASLGRKAGARSHRHKLTEPFLDQWGDTIHVNELTTMSAAGDGDFICFLIGMSAAHSNAPSADKVEYYSPKNLYKPIFLANGDVNPENYWAAFVARAVTAYKPFIHQWEVWNEPDQVGGNWQATTKWKTEAPKPADLVWWNDSIYAYVRLLRVTYEVVHKLDPDGKVTLGGIGYPSFLSAILRYTDEPNAGAVDGEHPQKGGAYFDTVSFHYYPVFGPGNSDVGAAGLIEAQAKLQAELDVAGVTGKGFVVTESGAPRVKIGDAPGGVEYARNYLVKAMVLAQLAGIERIDWYLLGDTADAGASQDNFRYMGLYENLTKATNEASAVITESGIAYATLSGQLAGAKADVAATAALGLGAGTQGVALQTASGGKAYVVWAEASDETGSGKVTLPASGAVTVRAWDASKTQQTKSVTPSGGHVEIDVGSSPVIVTE